MKRLCQCHMALALVATTMTLGFVLSCASSPPAMLPTDDAGAQWDATVDEHIDDVQRAEKLKQLGRQLDVLQKSLSADIAGLEEKFIALNANHSSTEEEMWQLVNSFEPKRKAALDHYRDIIFAMRREVSEEEWEAMAD